MALSPNYTITGNVGTSFDATSGSSSSGGNIQVSVPEGSTIEAAFLYASTFAGLQTVGVTLTNGSNSLVVDDFVSLGTNIFLTAYRSDVTEFIEDVVGDGDAAVFDINAGSLVGSSIDGFALVVVYSNAALGTSTVSLLDGFSASSGDNFTVTFAEPIDLADPEFSAVMSLGIGFGFQGNSQASEVRLNGELLTSSAGGQDDGFATDGALITIGGLGDSIDNPDPNSGPNGDPRQDDELYDLVPFLSNGDTSIDVDTLNPSNDDNIFFAAFITSADAVVTGDFPNGVPDNYVMLANTTLTVNAAGGVLGNDTDADGIVVGATQVDPVSGGSLSFNPDGSFSFTPPAGATGNFTFSYTATDDDGLNSFETQVTITVNDSGGGGTVPEANDDGIFVTVFDQPGRIEGSWLLANDSDPNGDLLTISSVQNAVGGTVVLDGSGVLFTPNGGHIGPASFTYTITDGNGNFDTATATIKVGGDEGPRIARGTDGDDIVIGSRKIDRLYGGDGDDVIYGFKQSDKIYGGTGEDTIYGNGGNDVLRGGSGSDLIYGGDKDDRIWGDNDNDGNPDEGFADTFAFDMADGSDTVFDFEDGLDRIYLTEGGVYSLSASGGNTVLAYGSTTVTFLNAVVTDADIVFAI